MNCEEIKTIITKFIHDEVEKTGLKNVVIGLSGGLDSSVAVTLAVEALGKERVMGILMPGKESEVYDENKNFLDAFNLAKSLDIVSFIIPVTKIINNDYIMGRVHYRDNSEFRYGNIKARARMTILYDMAKENNAIVLGTTNKTELLLGYFTKYGDGGVDIEPIADLYKTEVFKLARYIGIVDTIINKPPSADLWDGQTDEEELDVTYEEADKILWWLIEEDYDALTLSRDLEKLTSITDKKVLNRVVDLMDKNHHKTHMPNSCKIGNIDMRTTMANRRKDNNA